MKDYFQRLHSETGTRFWINNPTAEELALAMANDAFSCTTNPAYCAKLINQEPEYIHQVIDEVIMRTKDDNEAASEVYRQVTKRLMNGMLPLFEESGGTKGFVTIQADPREDEDTDSTIRAAMENNKLQKNFMAKIPVIRGGIEAIEACIEENIVICATEVFSVSQAVTICEMYEKVCRRTGNHPAFYVTHISGIFDEYLEKVAKRENIPVKQDLIDHAGLLIARKEYKLLREKGYHVNMLGGGARKMNHFTGLVGGNAHITINWSTAKEMIDSNIEIESLIDTKADARIIDELKEVFPDFQKAYDDQGMGVESYAAFGPVQLFRNAFLKGWYILLAEIASRRHMRAI